MRQIIFASFRTTPSNEEILEHVLHQSRRNNALDGITGLLWVDSFRFLQVFEGPCASIEPCFQRISSDSRHHSLELISDRTVDHHDFYTWNTLNRNIEDGIARYDAIVKIILSDASEAVRTYFTCASAPKIIPSIL